MTERIQRKRTKGWRMPKGAIYVGRPSTWGNPFTGDRAHAVNLFERYMKLAIDTNAPWLEDYLAPLRGHPLACWCPIGQPCHADVLFRLANPHVKPTGS